MAYGETKVYFDGSHYIAIPKKSRPSKKSVSVKSEKENKLKNEFEVAYSEVKNEKKKDKIKIITEKLKDSFESKEKVKEFIEENMKRKTRNAIYRRMRLIRKLNLNKWNYFITFTYDGNILTEEEFKKKLTDCFKKLTSRKQWKYIGVWERGSSTQRLHFHGVFQIPENAMVGELVEVKDYDTRNHKMRTTLQNTYFTKRFGRNDFSIIDDYPNAMNDIAKYLIKYIEKSGEKIVSSRNVKGSFYSDIMDEDILAIMGDEEHGIKLVLSDEFGCWDEGCLIGTVSPEVIDQMRKANI